jgi:hypothetical protein
MPTGINEEHAMVMDIVTMVSLPHPNILVSHTFTLEEYGEEIHEPFQTLLAILKPKMRRKPQIITKQHDSLIGLSHETKTSIDGLQNILPQIKLITRSTIDSTAMIGTSIDRTHSNPPKLQVESPIYIYV